jgi:glycosyltransferase involved in cell wall biosynthesis
MKILLLINTFGSGGAERSTYELAKYLIREQVPVAAAALNHKPVGIEAQFQDLPIPTYVGDGKSRRERLRYVIDVIRRERPDIVHSVVFEANLLARLARPFTPPYALVQSIVNTPYVKGRSLDRGLVGRMKFWLAKQADVASARLSRVHYHAITESVVRHYQPLFGLNPADFTIVHRGRVSPDCPPKIESNEALRLINVGRQDYQKGQVLIVEALDRLHRERSITGITLDIFGREGTQTPAIRSAIERGQLANRVRLRGFSDDIPAELCAADVFVFPSHFEGLGGALIEAMSAGLPCICSDIPVLREVVGGDAGALFFEPGNAGELANCIHRIHTEPELRHTLSRASRRRFHEAFELESISAQMLDMYRRVHRDRA